MKKLILSILLLLSISSYGQVKSDSSYVAKDTVYVTIRKSDYQRVHSELRKAKDDNGLKASLVGFLFLINISLLLFTSKRL